MKRIVMLAAVSLAISACGPVTVPTKGANIVVIRYNEGGIIQDFAANVRKLNKAGTKVVIDGVCGSSCTMYLAVRNVCLTPRASLQFHGAWLPSRGLYTDAQVAHFKHTHNSIMANHYPTEIRKAFMAKWRHIGPTRPMHKLNAKQVRAMAPNVRMCK